MEDVGEALPAACKLVALAVKDEVQICLNLQ